MPVQYKACKCGVKIPRSLKRCAECEKVCQSDYNTHRRDMNAKEFYQSKEWKATRLIVLQQNPFCSCGRPAAMVDHIVEIKDGGARLDMNNLVGMCFACHNRKTAEERKRRQS